MRHLCAYCEITGRESYVGTLTLEQCKSKCLVDATCLGIDFRKYSATGSCYLNFEQNVNFRSYANYESWSKTNYCGILFNSYN